MGTRKNTVDSFEEFVRYRRVKSVYGMTIIVLGRNRKDRALAYIRAKCYYREHIERLVTAVNKLMDLDPKVKEAIPAEWWNRFTAVDPFKDCKEYVHVVLNLMTNIIGKCIRGALDWIRTIDTFIDDVLYLELKTYCRDYRPQTNQSVLGMSEKRSTELSAAMANALETIPAKDQHFVKA